MKEIIIDPITRLEGHGNVSIFLNDQGEVENAYSNKAYSAWDLQLEVVVALNV